MQTAALIVVVVAIVALLVWALLRLRKRDGVGGIAGKPARSRRGREVATGNDPMAPVVARHSEAVEPHDAAVEELRLRAQANRVAAAEHEREADALTASATAEARLQAQAHHEAAAKHQRTADELEQQIPPR
jgi:hypothetical protein